MGACGSKHGQPASPSAQPTKQWTDDGSDSDSATSPVEDISTTEKSQQLKQEQQGGQVETIRSQNEVTIYAEGVITEPDWMPVGGPRAGLSKPGRKAWDNEFEERITPKESKGAKGVPSCATRKFDDDDDFEFDYQDHIQAQPSTKMNGVRSPQEVSTRNGAGESGFNLRGKQLFVDLPPCDSAQVLEFHDEESDDDAANPFCAPSSANPFRANDNDAKRLNEIDARLHQFHEQDIQDFDDDPHLRNLNDGGGCL